MPAPRPKPAALMSAASSSERRTRLDIYFQYSRISEESVNRWAILLAFPLLLAAAAPAALVTGAIRDQFGDPIEGATVSTLGGQTTTDANGTFALEVNGVRSVTITCRFCRRTLVPVAADGEVVAIVHRYTALSAPAPSVADIASLPYAHAASVVSLHPFTELNDSSSVLPGPRVSTYGASAFGGLLIDNGIPQYDIAAGISAWRAFPAFDLRSVDVRDQRDAFRYGDMAGGGTFTTDTQTASAGSALILAGTENALNVSQSARYGTYNVAASSDEEQSTLRVDGAAHVQVGDGEALTIGGLIANDRLFPNVSGIQDNATGLRAHFESTRAQRVFADVIVDRAGYNTFNNSGRPVTGLWSDVTTQAGVVSNTPVQLFAAFSTRWSTGFYDASQVGIPRVAGTITQMQGLIGAQRTTDRYTVEGGVSVFSVGYGGGTTGFSHPLSATILTPSLSGSYNFDTHWNVEVAASGAFRLPSLLEAYATTPFVSQLAYDRYGSVLESIGYSDTKRLRVSLLQMNENVSNLDEGTVASTGAQIAWQATPTISLRAWGMHVNDTTHTDYSLYRFARTPLPATVGSAWLTYEVPRGLRIDALYRRDLTDFRPDTHFDASVSGPLTSTMRWFASTEKFQGERYVSAGLRWDVP